MVPVAGLFGCSLGITLMQTLPHNYSVRASSAVGKTVLLSSQGIPDLETEAPPEFGGPGGLWSPEHMFAGTVANCFILSFRAVATASKLEWTSIDCDVEAILDRVERATKFTEIRIKTALRVPPGADAEKAKKLLAKAKKICLITNSMTTEITLETDVVTA